MSWDSKRSLLSYHLVEKHKGKQRTVMLGVECQIDTGWQDSYTFSITYMYGLLLNSCIGHQAALNLCLKWSARSREILQQYCVKLGPQSLDMLTVQGAFRNENKLMCSLGTNFQSLTAFSPSPFCRIEPCNSFIVWKLFSRD